MGVELRTLAGLLVGKKVDDCYVFVTELRRKAVEREQILKYACC